MVVREIFGTPYFPTVMKPRSEKRRELRFLFELARLETPAENLRKSQLSKSILSGQAPPRKALLDHIDWVFIDQLHRASKRAELNGIAFGLASSCLVFSLFFGKAPLYRKALATLAAMSLGRKAASVAFEDRAFDKVAVLSLYKRLEMIDKESKLEKQLPESLRFI